MTDESTTKPIDTGPGKSEGAGQSEDAHTEPGKSEDAPGQQPKPSQDLPDTAPAPDQDLPDDDGQEGA